MRSSIRKGKPRVDMEAIDRRAFAATTAACEFMVKNLDPSQDGIIEVARTVIKGLKTIESAFPAAKKAALAST